ALELRVMTFGVVLFTLLVQGITIEKLINRLHLGKKLPQREAVRQQQALLFAKRAGLLELNRLHDNGWLFRDIWESMNQVYDEEVTEVKELIRTHLQDYPELEQELYLLAREDVLKAERSALTEATRAGLIAEEIEEELVIELNNRLAAIEILKENRELDGFSADESEDAHG
ncbi:MAG: hypothetical protein KC421_23410, partial [Anaerolineales bacterium]|nr:hypothetical protein [Anaerolineales bacterium]